MRLAIRRSRARVRGSRTGTYRPYRYSHLLGVLLLQFVARLLSDVTGMPASVDMVLRFVPNHSGGVIVVV